MVVVVVVMLMMMMMMMDCLGNIQIFLGENIEDKGKVILYKLLLMSVVIPLNSDNKLPRK